jgi:uncharacterized protein (TIGR00299 family) protein
VIAYFDMFSGVAGDMILGGLIDAGLDPAALRVRLRGLPVPPFELEVRRVRRGALAATLAAWRFEVDSGHRRLPEIERVVRGAGFPARVEERCLAVFRRLAEAEGRVHGIPAAEVHFHEVGALDAILDVCGVVSGLDLLGVERVEASPFRTGSGYVEAAHGRLPVPAPAVAFLIEGWRLEPVAVEGELTTPTGAAIVSTLAIPPGGPPLLVVGRVGFGAGSRDPAELPNCLRVILGEDVRARVCLEAPPLGKGMEARVPDEVQAGGEAPIRGEAAAEGEASGAFRTERLALVETDIDDMNPQLYGWLEERLFEAGAREVVLVPVSMKKGRPGTLVRCLAEEGRVDALAEVLFRESTTIGLRSWPVQRRVLPRGAESRPTSLGSVRVKRVRGVDGRDEVRPEYEECRRIAAERKLPLRAVLAQLTQELASPAEGRSASGGGGTNRVV